MIAGFLNHQQYHFKFWTSWGKWWEFFTSKISKKIMLNQTCTAKMLYITRFQQNPEVPPKKLSKTLRFESLPTLTVEISQGTYSSPLKTGLPPKKVSSSGALVVRFFKIDAPSVSQVVPSVDIRSEAPCRCLNARNKLKAKPPRAVYQRKFSKKLLISNDFTVWVEELPFFFVDPAVFFSFLLNTL